MIIRIVFISSFTVLLASLLLAGSVVFAEEIQVETTVDAEASVSIDAGGETDGAPSATSPNKLIPAMKPPFRILSPDKREDALDQREDRMDKREDRRDAATTTGPKDRLEDIRDKKEDVLDRAENRLDKAEDRREALAEQTKERIKAYMARMIRRLETAVDRLEKLAERIGSRIEKLEAAGADTAEAGSLLATAQIEIGEADVAVSQVVAGIDAIVEAEDRQGAMGELRILIKASVDAIKEAHRALSAVVAELHTLVIVETEVSADATIEQ